MKKVIFGRLFFSFLLLNCIKLMHSKCPEPYSHCNLGHDGMINVHLVSHTHDDVGWLKTVDQYYYGSNTGEQEATVQYVLDSVVEELAKDANRRFVYVEMAYFWRWWSQQTDLVKQLVRMLVSEGRLEFVIAGWSMNDEATTYYQDIIDQQTLGLQFVLKEFGSCARPRAAWQIDPFGHSREQASLFAQFGFDGLFLGRLDYQDSDVRSEAKTREMLWQASESLDADKSQLFTGVLPFGYNPPPGFCFDQYCDDEPIMDDPNLDEYNVDRKVRDFINYTLNQAKSYRTKNLIMTMGSDFQYSNANRWYKNLDKLIKYVNAEQQNGSNINIFYSTTACYLYSLHKSNTSWPVKRDDFFPYAHRPHAFWTGYFTSRPNLKEFVRRTGNYLQIARQFAAFADLDDFETEKALNTLERAMAIAQHHDAVSGTERQHVAFDYAKRLSNGINQNLKTINKALSRFLGESLDFEMCPLLNVSECRAIEGRKEFRTLIYNPLPREVSTWIRLPVLNTNYEVKYEDSLIRSEFAQVYAETKSIPERSSNANYELVFKTTLPSLGYKIFDIKQSERAFKVPKQRKIKKDSEFSIQNDYLQLNFDAHGNLIQLLNVENSLSTNLKQSFCIYKSMPGNNSEPEFTASGAYIFRPLNNTSDCLRVSHYSLYKGSQFDEVHQVYNSWLSQTIRLYADARHAEFEFQAGPIYVDDEIGREVVIRFDSDLDSRAQFYTDSNGREILRRKLNHRPTWRLNQTESVSGNYYPVNSRIFIRDEEEDDIGRLSSTTRRQLTLVNDRSQGGSSLTGGSLELMLHRRTLYDDALGVHEPINETGSDGKGLIAKGKIHLLFDTVEKSARLHRELAHKINNQPLALFSVHGSAATHSLSSSEWSGLKLSLPPNLHLLTMMKVFNDEYEVLSSLLVRIEHFYAKDEDALFSKPVKVNLFELFGRHFNVTDVQELALGANMRVEDLEQRLKWNSDSDLLTEIKSHRVDKQASFSKASDFTYVFYPMQIRTFRIWFLPFF